MWIWKVGVDEPGSAREYFGHFDWVAAGNLELKLMNECCYELKIDLLFARLVVLSHALRVFRTFYITAS
jgi:hypothetical protein